MVGGVGFLVAVDEAAVDVGLLGEVVGSAEDVPGLLVVQMGFDEAEEIGFLAVEVFSQEEEYDRFLVGLPTAAFMMASLYRLSVERTASMAPGKCGSTPVVATGTRPFLM